MTPLRYKMISDAKILPSTWTSCCRLLTRTTPESSALRHPWSWSMLTRQTNFPRNGHIKMSECSQRRLGGSTWKIIANSCWVTRPSSAFTNSNYYVATVECLAAQWELTSLFVSTEQSAPLKFVQACPTFRLSLPMPHTRWDLSDVFSCAHGATLHVGL